jgi:hypothetical protein
MHTVGYTVSSYNAANTFNYLTSYKNWKTDCGFLQFDNTVLHRDINNFKQAAAIIRVDRQHQVWPWIDYSEDAVHFCGRVASKLADQNHGQWEGHGVCSGPKGTVKPQHARNHLWHLWPT